MIFRQQLCSGVRVVPSSSGQQPSLLEEELLLPFGVVLWRCRCGCGGSGVSRWGVSQGSRVHVHAGHCRQRGKGKTLPQHEGVDLHLCHNSGGGLLRHCPSLLPLPGHGDAQEREARAEVMVMPTYHAKCAQTIFIHIGRQNEYISARKQVLKSYGCCCNSSSSSGCCCCCCSVAAAAAAAITRSSLATAAGFILIRASRRLEEARELHSP